VGAFVAGTAFMFVQGLAYLGYIDVKWNKVQKEIMGALDADGDGEVTTKDAKVFGEKLMNVLRFNLPASGSFAAGFVIGVRL